MLVGPSLRKCESEQGCREWLRHKGAKGHCRLLTKLWNESLSKCLAECKWCVCMHCMKYYDGTWLSRDSCSHGFPKLFSFVTCTPFYVHLTFSSFRSELLWVQIFNNRFHYFKSTSSIMLLDFNILGVQTWWISLVNIK